MKKLNNFIIVFCRSLRNLPSEFQHLYSTKNDYYKLKTIRTI